MTFSVSVVTKFAKTEQHCVHMSYAKFHQNHTINVKVQKKSIVAPK
jgi:hypothetical protein